MEDNLSALKIQEGVIQQPSIDPQIYQKFKRKKFLTSGEYVEGILKGNINILSQSITLVESTLDQHQNLAWEIVDKCLPYTGKSFRLGITGVPGVGKSSFIESFGNLLITKNHKLAVLAIDPSSEKTQGSILGDKTRMESLANQENAYIRPSPSAGTLGGVANKTKESMLLCEAAGFDYIFIETVGVGQSETAVYYMVDFFMLLMLAGAGDELQGIKRGIMEMADSLIITKADSDNTDKAQMAKIEYLNALHLFPKTESGWSPKVLLCSAHQKTGLEEIYNMLTDYHKLSKTFIDKRRNEQSNYWFYESIKDEMLIKFYSNESIKQKIVESEKQINQGILNPYHAAKNILNEFFSTLKK